MTTQTISFQDIPQFPTAHYSVDVDWKMLERHIEHAIEFDGLNLEPSFQRAHVWNRQQQIAFVEYQLQGGEVGIELTFNCPGWLHAVDKIGPYEIVDGKQRLEAVRAFLRDDLPAFGQKFSEFTGTLRIFHSFKWRICTLETRAEVLQLYLNINAGGTPHTKQELNKVRQMLAAAKSE
jgi:hypothetical protein